jgi:hypothetical protein
MPYLDIIGEFWGFTSRRSDLDKAYSSSPLRVKNEISEYWLFL